MASLFVSIKTSLIVAGISLAALAFGPCASSAPKNKMAAGSWGGQHIALEISESGADVELDCAHGRIAQAISPDKKGNFDVPGTYSPEHGGPVRKDESPKSDPARYSGHVDGDTMTITITRGNDQIGPYELRRGAQASLMKCR